MIKLKDENDGYKIKINQLESAIRLSKAHHPWIFGVGARKQIPDILRNASGVFLMPYSNSRDKSDIPRHKFQFLANKMTGVPKV